MKSNSGESVILLNSQEYVGFTVGIAAGEIQSAWAQSIIPA